MPEHLPRRLGGPPLARSTLDRTAQLRNDPVWLAERHGIMPESADTLGQMSAALANLAAIATKAP